ncbi:MAG: hypothetical protein M3217_11675 [Actinomycetota bacterium]|nr:hypothetical protein [Actinomycetota bacterium]
MRVVRIAILSAALSVMGIGFAAPASACRPINNGCSGGSCHLRWEEPDVESGTWAAPYLECYY